MTKIAVAKGDGIGPEIMDAVLSIFDAAILPLEYITVDMGKWLLPGIHHCYRKCASDAGQVAEKNYYDFQWLCGRQT